MVIRLQKKAAGEFFWTNWAEVFFLLLIVIGFFVSITVRSPVLSYIAILCAGLMGGRILAKKIKKQPLFPYFLIILGFLAGYLLGSFTINVNRILLIILFAVGGIASYIIHKKGYIK